MPHKHLLFSAEARDKILRGVNAITDAMRVTFGPKSKSVLFEKRGGPLLVCNDGVTITKEFELEDRATRSVVEALRRQSKPEPKTTPAPAGAM